MDGTSFVILYRLRIHDSYYVSSRVSVMHTCNCMANQEYIELVNHVALLHSDLLMKSIPHS